MKKLRKRTLAYSLVMAAVIWFGGASTISASALLSVIPEGINFGNVPTGVSNTQTVTLSNPGNVQLNLTQITVKGAGYSLSGLNYPISISIVPGRSFAFTLRFAPTVAGLSSGNIAIVSNASNPLLNIPVRGYGVFASLHLSMSATSLNFGSVGVGSESVKMVTLSNTGNAKFTVSGIKVSGSAFSANGFGVPFTLGVGQSATFNVEYTPLSFGSSTGSVSVSSTASSTPASVSLSGSASQRIVHSVILTWAASGANVVGYHVYRGAQTSGPFTRLSSSLVSGTMYTDSTVQIDRNYSYVATAVDEDGVESPFSNEISVAIP